MILRVSFVGLMALVFATVVQAVSVRPPNFAELVGSADAIVMGSVTSVESTLRIVDGRSVPFTNVTIAVSETLKGAAKPTVVLHLLGGTVGAQSLRVAGAPAFAVGDQGFFFVQNNGAQVFPLVAIGHGFYRNVRDETTGAEFVARANRAPLRSITEVSAALGPNIPPEARIAAATHALTPAEFAQEIKTEANRHAR